MVVIQSFGWNVAARIIKSDLVCVCRRGLSRRWGRVYKFLCSIGAGADCMSVRSSSGYNQFYVVHGLHIRVWLIFGWKWKGIENGTRFRYFNRGSRSSSVNATDFEFLKRDCWCCFDDDDAMEETGGYWQRIFRKTWMHARHVSQSELPIFILTQRQNCILFALRSLFFLHLRSVFWTIW